MLSDPTPCGDDDLIRQRMQVENNSAGSSGGDSEPVIGIVLGINGICTGYFSSWMFGGIYGFMNSISLGIGGGGGGGSCGGGGSSHGGGGCKVSATEIEIEENPITSIFSNLSKNADRTKNENSQNIKNEILKLIPNELLKSQSFVNSELAKLNFLLINGLDAFIKNYNPSINFSFLNIGLHGEDYRYEIYGCQIYGYNVAMSFPVAPCYFAGAIYLPLPYGPESVTWWNTANHEFGHYIQELVFGTTFFTYYIAIPSFLSVLSGDDAATHDNLWFEKQATNFGKLFFNIERVKKVE